MKKYTKKSEPLRQLDSTKAGIDIGSKSVFVCISRDKDIQEVREFPFFTKDIEHMGAWLLSHGVTSIAMESTGIYWQPLFEILAPLGFELLLCNARYIKNLPGRKTDVKDAQWIQQLHSAGLLSGSFRPPDNIIPLRAYCRKKKKLTYQASQQINLMYKALRELNIQLDLVLSSTAGKTCLAIIKAIIEGERDPDVLAGYREKTVKCSIEELKKALYGNWREEHIFELSVAYDLYQAINVKIALCEEKIKQALSRIKENIPQDRSEESSMKAAEENNDQIVNKKKSKTLKVGSSREVMEMVTAKVKTDLTAIPGISQNTMLTVIAECGVDMSKFPTVKHFVSWLGLCPRNDISGGKILCSKTKPSSNRAAQALRLAAFSLLRSDSSMGAYFRRMRAKLGAPKAITATAHKIARILYTMLKYGISYQELGADYYEAQHKKRVLSSLVKKAATLGFELIPIANVSTV